MCPPDRLGRRRGVQHRIQGGPESRPYPSHCGLLGVGLGLVRAKLRVHRHEATPPPQGDSGAGTEVWQPRMLAAGALGLLSVLSSHKGLRK